MRLQLSRCRSTPDRGRRSSYIRSNSQTHSRIIMRAINVRNPVKRGPDAISSLYYCGLPVCALESLPQPSAEPGEAPPAASGRLADREKYTIGTSTHRNSELRLYSIFFFPQPISIFSYPRSKEIERKRSKTAGEVEKTKVEAQRTRRRGWGREKSGYSFSKALLARHFSPVCVRDRAGPLSTLSGSLLPRPDAYVYAGACGARTRFRRTPIRPSANSTEGSFLSFIKCSTGTEKDAQTV